MKYFLFIVSIVSIIACRKSIEDGVSISKNYTVQDFIEVNENLEVNSYFNHLSKHYVDLLKGKYNTSKNEVVIDSLSNEKQQNKLVAKANSYKMSHIIIDSLVRMENDLKVYKYIIEVYDPLNEANMYSLQLLLQTKEDNQIKYIPYSAKNTLNTRNLLYELYTPEIVREIDAFSIHDKFIPKNPNQKEIISSFQKYSSLLHNGDPNFSEFLNPNVIKGLNIIGKKENFDYKSRLLSEYKESFFIKNSHFNEVIIQDLNKLPCQPATIYSLRYSIRLGDASYISGHALVTFENYRYYFVEYDDEVIQSDFPNLFDEDLFTCIKSRKEMNKRSSVN